MFNQDYRKLVVAFGPGPEAQALRARCLEMLGKVFGHKLGRPPAGNSQKMLASFLEQMVG